MNHIRRVARTTLLIVAAYPVLLVGTVLRGLL